MRVAHCAWIVPANHVIYAECLLSLCSFWESGIFLSAKQDGACVTSPSKSPGLWVSNELPRLIPFPMCCRRSLLGELSAACVSTGRGVSEVWLSPDITPCICSFAGFALYPFTIINHGCVYNWKEKKDRKMKSIASYTSHIPFLIATTMKTNNELQFAPGMVSITHMQKLHLMLSTVLQSRSHYYLPLAGEGMEA